MGMEIISVPVKIPEGANVIIGQTHFIKSVEDIYEAIMTATSGRIKFGLAFSEASGACLIRLEGNNEALTRLAAESLLQIGAGHSFLILLQEGFPINILNVLKQVPEVCSIFCATANPVEVILFQGKTGRAVLGVIDGASPKGIEDKEGITWRKEFLRKVGYKR